jgi:hypothetical protein
MGANDSAKVSRHRWGRWPVVLAAIALIAGVSAFLAWHSPQEQAGAPATSSEHVAGTTSIELPLVRGRPESCLACHSAITGLGVSHRPDAIGCAACHAGDPSRADRERAHAGLIRVPGNLADAGRTCGQAGCHAGIPARVERSIMTTMAGVIAVDRRMAGEAADPHAPLPHAGALGNSAADSHLRELCISCHLGQPKTEWGPITQESRGGGCNACHLSYAPAAREQLALYQATAPDLRSAVPDVHPSLTVNPTNEHCFGCHSRSSRIATSFEGWHELHASQVAAAMSRARKDASRLRKLDDGRLFERAAPDIHHERGLDCIDCHTANELMGTGAVVARKSEQLRVGCQDCHTSEPASVAPASVAPESRSLLALRGLALEPSQRLGAARNGEPLVNVIVDADGRARLHGKRTGKTFALKPPLAVCTEGNGHARLSCVSCHSSWAPRCPTCHTSFDPAGEGFDHLAQQWVKGTWNETAGPFEMAPPTLGVRSARGGDGSATGTIDTFVPGMIMTFDRNRQTGKPPDIVFRRWYGRIVAHTIRREARACTSCHNDPVALGYGQGTLRFVRFGSTGAWQFTPREKPSPYDGLPADAWIGFPAARDGMVSTHDDLRPFTVEEQRRILTVGACLTCHAGDSALMRRSVADFAATLARRSAKCAVPRW